jgi:hypothetical protein
MGRIVHRGEGRGNGSVSEGERRDAGGLVKSASWLGGAGRRLCRDKTGRIRRTGRAAKARALRKGSGANVRTEQGRIAGAN